MPTEEEYRAMEGAALDGDVLPPGQYYGQDGTLTIGDETVKVDRWTFARKDLPKRLPPAAFTALLLRRHTLTVNLRHDHRTK